MLFRSAGLRGIGRRRSRCARLTRRGGRSPASGLPAAAGPDEEDTPSDGEDDDNDDGDDQVFHNGPSLADARGRSGHEAEISANLPF